MLSPIEAASIWMQYFTALAIVEVAKAGIGDYVLIPAASSSVGLAAIQLANWAGAVPIAATRHRAKAAGAQANGAAHVIATAESDVAPRSCASPAARARASCSIRWAARSSKQLANAMAAEGMLFIYGGLSGQPTPFPALAGRAQGLELRGWVAASIWNKPERFERAKTLISARACRGQPRTDRRQDVPACQIVEAHRYLESNQQIGKIVVTV